MIEIQHLVKRFGSLAAVNDVSLTVGAGEIFGFLGPNGAGKTTTLRIMAGLLLPTAGRVRIAGYDVVQEPEAAKAVLGFIPDRPFLYEKLTAWEYLEFVAGLHGLSRADLQTRASELLRFFGLGDWQDELIEAFSHGMKQRLVLAAALLHRPRVLIVDEPMVGLDPRGARLLKELFKGLRSRGVTVFLSTHSLEVAEEMCDRIAIIQEGRLIAQGTVPELRAQARAHDARLEAVFLRLTGGEDVAGALRLLEEEGWIR